MARKSRHPWHDRLRATLRLRGDTLSIDTNSEARADRLLSFIHDCDPTADVLADDRKQIDDLRERCAAPPRALPDASEHALDPRDPALVEMSRTFEQPWLDESIPALAGRQPARPRSSPLAATTCAACSTRSMTCQRVPA